jgi:hypothetical protein
MDTARLRHKSFYHMTYSQDIAHQIASPAFKYGFRLSTRDPYKHRPEDLPWYERKEAINFLKMIALRLGTTAYYFLWRHPYSRVICISVSTEVGIGDREAVRQIVIAVNERHEHKPGARTLMRLLSFKDIEPARAYVHKVAKRIQQLVQQDKIPLFNYGPKQRPRRRRQTSRWLGRL